MGTHRRWASRMLCLVISTFFFLFHSGIIKHGLAPTELTAILKTTMTHEREQIFLSTQSFRLLSTNAWYLSLSVSIDSFIVAPGDCSHTSVHSRSDTPGCCL